MVEFKTSSAKETEKLGIELAASLRLGGEVGKFASMNRFIEANIKSEVQALVFALSGELGAGKTTFIKGLANGLGVKETITSPTYVFVRSYSFPTFRLGGQDKNKFYHLDLYRLEGSLDSSVLDSIEFKEIISDNCAIVAIEWAERLKSDYLKRATEIIFNYVSAEERSAVFNHGNI